MFITVSVVFIIVSVIIAEMLSSIVNINFCAMNLLCIVKAM